MENSVDILTPESIPYIAHEAEIARHERHVKRLVIALVTVVIVFILAITAIVGVFVWYLNQFDVMSYDQDGEGVNIIGSSNGVDFNVAASAFESEAEPIFRQGSYDTETAQNPQT